MKNIKRLLTIIVSIMMVIQIIPANALLVHAESVNMYSNNYIQVTTENESNNETTTISEAGQMTTLPSHKLIVKTTVDGVAQENLEIDFNKNDPGKTKVKALEGYEIESVTLNDEKVDAENMNIVFEANVEESLTMNVLIKKIVDEKAQIPDENDISLYAISGPSSVNVGETIRLTGSDGNHHNWSVSDSSKLWITSNSNLKSIQVEGKKATNSVTVTHGYIPYGRIYMKYETFTLQVLDTSAPTISNQTAYFYVVKPGVSLSERYDNYNWYNMGKGSVSMPNVKDQNLGTTTYDMSVIKNEPSNFANIIHDGKTYKYVSEYTGEANTYTISWKRMVVSDGANGGINGGPTLANGNKTYHVDGVATLYDKASWTVSFYVQDPGETSFGLPERSATVEEGTLHNVLDAPSTENKTYGNETYVFDGWYTDVACTNRADLTKGSVTDTENYYGKYVPELKTSIYDDGTIRVEENTTSGADENHQGKIYVKVYKDGVLVNHDHALYYIYNDKAMVDVDVKLYGHDANNYIINKVFADQTNPDGSKNNIEVSGGKLDNVTDESTVSIYLTSKYRTTYYKDGKEIEAYTDNEKYTSSVSDLGTNHKYDAATKAGYKTSINVKALPNAEKGYKTIGWILKDNEINENSIYTIETKDANAFAGVFSFECASEEDESQWFTVKYVAGENGSLDADDKSSYRVVIDTAWSKVSAPKVMANDNYKFVGWYENDELVTSFPETVTENHTYTAKFLEGYHVYYYESDKNLFDKDVIVDNNLYSTGESVQVVNKDVSHDQTHTLIGWTTNKDLIKNDQNVVNKKSELEKVMKDSSFVAKGAEIEMGSEDINLYAIWARNDIDNQYKYVINYLYEDAEKLNETVESKAYINEQITSYEDKLKDGYVLDYVEGLPLTISDDEVDNVINVYYVKDTNGDKIPDKYQVKVTYKVVNGKWNDETSEEKSEIVTLYDDDGKYSEDGTGTLSSIPVVGEKPSYGYKEGNWKVAPTTETKITKESNKVFTYTYEKDDEAVNSLTYTVQHMVDGTHMENDDVKVTKDIWVNADKTLEVTAESIEANTYVGYKYTGMDQEVTAGDVVADKTTIKLFYDVDEEQTTEVSYTVEHWVDGTHMGNDDVTVTKDIWVNADKELEVTADSIKANTYVGYKYTGMDQEVVAGDVVTDTTTIKLLYDKDLEATTKVSYTVEHWVDGAHMENDDVTVTKDIWVNADKTLEVTAESIEANTYVGYKYIGMETEIAAGDVVTDKTKIKLLYAVDSTQTTKVSYTVEHWVDGTHMGNDDVTVTKDIWVNADKTLEVTAESIEANTYVGYKYTGMEVVAGNVVADETTIKLFYDVDLTQTKTLSYTVNYYVGNEVRDSETISTDVWINDPTNKLDVLTINEKEYDGYVFDYTDPSELPETIENGGVINVYYTEEAEENIPGTPVVPTTPTTPIPPTGPTTPVLSPLAPLVPVAPVTPVVTPTPDPEVITPEQTPQGGGEVEDVVKEETPKAVLSDGNWAFINLVCSIATVCLGLFLLISKRHKEEDEGEEEMSDDDKEEERKRGMFTRFLAIAVAILSVIVFVLTEDMTLPMVLMDKWTIAMVTMALVQVAILVIGRKWKHEDNEEEVIAQ